MASSSKAKGRKGKIGKNKSRIAAYYISGQNAFNKARKVLRHCRRYSNFQSDAPAHEALRNALAAMPQAMERRFKQVYDL